MGVKLTNEKGFRWNYICKNNIKIWTKGDIFISDRYISDNVLPIYSINTIKDTPIDGICSEIKKWNGSFSVVCETEDKIIAFVDFLRSFPLFYLIDSKEFYVTDEAETLAGISKDIVINEKAISEFKMFGYITGNETLLCNVKQVQAGELIVIKKDIKRIDRYRYCQCGYSRDGNIADLSASEKTFMLNNTILRVFERLAIRLNNRTAVISLSGGQDSRLIAVYLKRIGYKKIIAYTFGKEGNKEIETAKFVTEKLGIKWIFIPYNMNDWEKILKGVYFDPYYKYAGNYTSVAHMATMIAIEKMKKNNLLPDDSVFLNGGIYDETTGSWTQIDFIFKKKVSSDIIKQRILYRHGVLSQFEKNAWKSVCDKTLYNINGYLSSDNAIDLMSKWFIAERGSKFTHNTVRGYEFFNYPWYTPLEDTELIRFWQSVDPKDYICRRLHYQFANEYINPDMGITDSVPSPNYNLCSRLRSNYFLMYIGHYLRDASKNKPFRVRTSDPLGFFECFSDEELEEFVKREKTTLNGNSINIVHYLNLL